MTMIIKNTIRLAALLLAVSISSCDDDERVVTLYEKGATDATASTLNIRFGESVDFASNSSKALTTNWTFAGGNPATSINPNVTVSYANPGTYEAKLVIKYIDNTIETKIFSVVVAGIDPPRPFGTSAIELPGIIEAENYDLGGEGVGYHDNEEANLSIADGSASYRADDGVDIFVGTSATYVTHTNEGEWANYTVNVAEAGNFNFTIKVSSSSPSGGRSIRLQSMNQSTGATTNLGETGNFPSTGGSENFVNRTINNVPLQAGSNTLRLVYTGTDTNLDKIEVEAVGPILPVNGLGIFTERAITATNNGQTPVNNGNFSIALLTNDAYEGTRSYRYSFDPVNSGNTQTGFALSVMATATSPLNANPYNYYNIALKTTSTKNLRVRINTSAGNYWITLNSATDATYGMVRDGAWHSLKIPFTDFKRDGSGPDITPNKDRITGILVLRTDDSDYATYVSTPEAFVWFVDDLYLSVD